MKRFLSYLFLIVSLVLINIESVYAVQTPFARFNDTMSYKGINMGFVQSHGLASHLYSTVRINGTINVKANFDGQELILNNVSNIELRINNLTKGYCIDATAAAPTYQRLKPLYSMPISSDFVSYLYGWAENGSKSNPNKYTKSERELIAEQIFYALGEIDYFGTRGGGYGNNLRTFTNRNRFPNSASFALQIGNYLSATSTDSASNSLSKYVIPNGYKDIVNMQQYYQCLLAIANGNSSRIRIGCDSVKRSIEASELSDKTFEYDLEKKTLNVELNKNGLAPVKTGEISFNTIKSDEHIINVFKSADAGEASCKTSCNEICSGNATCYTQCANACASTDDRVNSILNFYIQQKSGGENGFSTGDALNLYDDIMNANPVSLMVYGVVDKDGNKIQGYQNIISITRDKIPQKSCSDYVATLRELGYSDSEIWELKSTIDSASNGNLVRNEETGEVKCSDRQSECAAAKSVWYNVISGWRYAGYSPKMGTLFAPIYTPKFTTINEGTTCECDVETQKFSNRNGSNAIYSSTCAEFKNWYQNIAKIGPMTQIAKCNDDTHTASCGTTIVGKPKCADKLTEARASGWDLNRFKNQISDPEKAIVNTAGQLDCLDACTPTVETANGFCSLKRGGSASFELKDATTDGINVNEACILANRAYSIDGSAVTSKDEEFSKSKYCDVYCWESLTAILPQDPAPYSYVQAGRMFFWGLDSNSKEKEFAEINTRRICWAKNINYNQYKADWNANEDEIAQAYANYQARVAYNNDNDDSHVYESNSKCCKSGDSAGSSSERLCDLNAEPNCRGTGRKYNGIIDICVCSTPESCSGGWGKEYTKKEITGVYVTSVTGNRKEGKSGTASSGCVDSKPSASSLKVSNSDSDLKTKIGNRQRLKTSLMACQSSDMINNNTIYKYTTTMKIKDNDNIKLANVRGVGDFSLTRSDSGNTDISSNVPAGSFATGCTDVGSYNTANPCAVADGTTIPTYANSTFAWDYTGVSKFLYNDNFHFYASADTDYVANKTLQTEKFNYAKADMMGLIYDMGVGIPTNINSYNGQFNIEVEINGLGNNGHFDKIAANKTKYGYDFNKYSCPYQLANVIYDYECGSNCSDRGLDIVYRIIDMPGGKNGIDLKKTVFPGKDGKGRKIGSNWAQFITDRYQAFKNIVTYGIIYDKTPIYSIDLSQTLITEIRRNNKTYSDKKMDPYTSYRDTDNKFKIKCSYNNAEKSCVSTYITTLIKQGKITGRFANPDEEQRINLIHSYKTCYDVDHPNC